MTLSRPPTMILTVGPSTFFPAGAAPLWEVAASLAQAASGSRRTAARAAAAVLRMVGEPLWTKRKRGSAAVAGVGRLPAEQALLGEGQQALGEQRDHGQDGHRGVHARRVEGALRGRDHQAQAL